MMDAAQVTLSAAEAQIIKDALSVVYREMDAAPINDRHRKDIDRILVKINLALK
jgi:hypothetical protein